MPPGGSCREAWLSQVGSVVLTRLALQAGNDGMSYCHITGGT